MTAEVTRLDHPIDVMRLIHKALRAEAARVEKLVGSLDAGGTLQAFKLAFNVWATALVYHADAELRKELTGAPSFARADGAPTLADQWKSAILAQEDEEHRQLVEKVQDVLKVLDEDIGKTSVIARTKQHLYGQVVALRTAQQDHLETEEALVLPLMRRGMTERQQLEAARSLLIDEQAQDPRWVIEWVSRELDPTERRLLADLETRFNHLESPAG